MVPRRATSAVKRTPTADVSDNMAYTVLREHRCAIATPNVHAQLRMKAMTERTYKAVNFVTAKILTVK